MIALEVKYLTKIFGALQAVADFNLSVPSGELVAVVGPDGAGKTTLFRCLCGLIDFNQGEIEIMGHSIIHDFERVKSILGYMPQNFSLYPDLSVEENLNFYAGLFGLESVNLQSKKSELYQFSGLEPFRNRRAGKLSGGMKQKLALSCNLVHDPKVLILDEPTTGVDPVSRRQFWHILKTLKDNGSTIIVSTPYMDEVALADWALFMFDGRFMTSGTPSQLQAQFKGEVYRADIIPDADTMLRLNGIDKLSSRRFGSCIHLYPEPGNNIDSYLPHLEWVGLNKNDITLIEADLEDTFIQFMERKKWPQPLS